MVVVPKGIYHKVLIYLSKPDKNINSFIKVVTKLFVIDSFFFTFPNF